MGGTNGRHGLFQWGLFTQTHLGAESLCLAMSHCALTALGKGDTFTREFYATFIKGNLCLALGK